MTTVWFFTVVNSHVLFEVVDPWKPFIAISALKLLLSGMDVLVSIQVRFEFKTHETYATFKWSVFAFGFQTNFRFQFNFFFAFHCGPLLHFIFWTQFGLQTIRIRARISALTCQIQVCKFNFWYTIPLSNFFLIGSSSLAELSPRVSQFSLSAQWVPSPKDAWSYLWENYKI